MKQMASMTDVAALRRVAKARIPRAIFDYADGGSYTEATLAANRADLAHLALRQRVMIDVSARSMTTTLVGQVATMPVAIAPTGLSGLFHVDGEIHGARAAAAAGIPFCLSTMSICSIEDVRSAVPDPFWFQVYFMRDRGFNQELIARALSAECPVLVLTVDLQVQGQRHRDIRNDLTVPPRLTLRNLADMLSRPRWLSAMARSKRRGFGNLSGRLADTGSLGTLSQWIASQFDPSMTWRDVEWVRGQWPGKLVVKGIMDGDDARAAIAAGADAIVVSNHGGRQLDGAPSSISRLAPIVEAVRGDCEVLFDGGVQSGQDVLRALALGARGCMVGKAYLYGLAAGGERGVRRVLDIIRSELDVSMSLTGVRDVVQINRSVLA